MRKTSLLGRAATVALASLALASCEEKLHEFVVTVDREFPFTFDTQSQVGDVKTLTRAQVLGALEIPEEAEIIDLHIETVRLVVQPGGSNTADEVRINVGYAKNNDAPTLLTALQVVPLLGIYDQPLDNLVAGVVNGMRADLLAMLRNDVGAPSQVRVAYGISQVTPTGSRFQGTGSVRVKFVVRYRDCMAFPAIPGPPEDDPQCEAGF